MLSEKSILEIEKATGITGLQEIIKSEEVQDVELKKTKHFAEQDYDILVKNLSEQGLTKEKYEEAKLAGEEMPIKELKKKYNLEFEGKNAEALYNFLNKQLELKTETDKGKIKEEYEKSLTELRNKIGEKDKEIETIKSNVRLSRINSEIDNHFNALQIDVPVHIQDENQKKEYVKVERERNKTYFKSLYNFDLEGDKIIAKKGEQIIKDDLQEPVTVDKLVNDYISSSFMNTGNKIKGRGEGDRLPGNNGQKFASLEDLFKFAEEKGIQKNTEAFDALYADFMKNK